MSVYTNFTNQQLGNSNIAIVHKQQQQQPQHLQQQQSQHGPNNGTQTRCQYQVDNDYLQRGFHQTNQNDVSVVLTRPTSKTALLVRQRRAMLEQLSCYLCKGYLIDATTVDECMDSFCKSCIVIHLRSHNNCPKCGTLIHKTNPLSAIRSDKVLQDIVYKLVPGLYDDEMKRRRDFYKGLYGTSSEDDDEDGSSSSFTGGRYSNMNSEQYGVISHPKSFYKPTDSIDLSIEPQTRGEGIPIYYDNKRQSIVTSFTGNLQLQQQNQQLNGLFSTVDSQQYKTYLRCPAKLTALQLKKFIAAKFNLCKDDTIYLRYLNESLKDEYSLIDIAYIYDWRGIEHMRLYYIIERDLSKSVNNVSDDDYKDRDGQLRKSKASRQSIGTSTQTVKRVCIDPNPKYYALEQNNNSIVNPSGPRLTRSRYETTSTSNNIAPTSSHAPILRSYSSGNKDRNGQQSTSANETVYNRELASLRDDTKRSSATNSVSSAVDELSRLRQDSSATKDTRSTRRLIADTAGSIPKININLNSLGRTKNAEHEQNNSNKSGVRFETHQREVATTVFNANPVVSIGNNNHVRQVVHYARQGCSTTTTAAMSNANVAGPTQSSMITLANLTQARSSHVMAIASASSTASLTNSSYRNLLGATGTSGKFETRPVEVKSNHISTKTTAQPTPQLAFSFVTERGITIVRSPAISSSSNRITTSFPALPAPPIPSGSQISGSSIQHGQSASSSSQTSQSSQSTNNHNQASHSGSGSSQTNASSSTTSPSGRHHIKVKPVYKTFVDPTKLKSPNFKKLGFTARH